MKENTRFIVMIVLLLIGIIKINEQQVDFETKVEQKGIVENDGMVMMDDQHEETIQVDQYFIKPLEQYPFDCEIIYNSKDSNCC